MTTSKINSETRPYSVYYGWGPSIASGEKADFPTASEARDYGHDLLDRGYTVAVCLMDGIMEKIDGTNQDSLF